MDVILYGIMRSRCQLMWNIVDTDVKEETATDKKNTLNEGPKG